MDSKDLRKIEARGIKDEGALDEGIRKALENLKKDERVYSLIRDKFKLKQSEVKASMVPFLNLLEDLHYCDHCPGLEKCDKSTPHYKIELTKEGGIIRTNYRLCPLAKEKRDYDNGFLIHDFPAEWWKKNLQNDVAPTEKKKAAKSQAIKILTGETDEWLFLRGRRRSGRTYLAACLANSFVKLGRQVAFADTYRLIEELKDLAIKDKETFEKRMTAYINCDLLVLDDFGNENHTSFVYSTILFPLLNGRAKANKPVVFTSDFTFDLIVDMYSQSVGIPQGTQMKYLLKDYCKKAYDITSVDIYS